ncbi:MAG: hypothetical protein ACETVQ_03735 [Candidatus Bathyarchaeia archaeon]
MAEESVDDRKKHLKELEEYLKTIPPPPLEHTAELKMERKLKRIIKKRKSK